MSAKIEVSTLIESIATLLSEAYLGPANSSESWFVDNVPDAGILSVLKGLSAGQASRSADGSGAPGTSIAAHVEHLRWSLANVNGALRGETYNTDWQESWAVNAADEAGWNALQQSLREEFEILLQALRAQNDLPGVYLNGTLALIPHAAYHLGVLRQIAERVG